MRFFLLFLALPLLSFGSERIPSQFLDVELLVTSMSEVKDRFGDHGFSKIPDGHHEKGICYQNNSNKVIFSTGPMGSNKYITGIHLLSKNFNIPCHDTKKEIPSCIGNICLGMTKINAQKNIGLEFTQTSSGESYVASEISKRDMTPDELKTFSGSEEYPYFDITQTIYLEEESGDIVKLGMYKYETF